MMINSIDKQKYKDSVKIDAAKVKNYYYNKYYNIKYDSYVCTKPEDEKVADNLMKFASDALNMFIKDDNGTKNEKAESDESTT